MYIIKAGKLREDINLNAGDVHVYCSIILLRYALYLEGGWGGDIVFVSIVIW